MGYYSQSVVTSPNALNSASAATVRCTTGSSAAGIVALADAGRSSTTGKDCAKKGNSTRTENIDVGEDMSNVDNEEDTERGTMIVFASIQFVVKFL